MPLLIAALAMIVAAVMLTTITRDTPAAYLLAAYFLFGLGTGLINPPITNTAVSGMPEAQAGVASAVASTSRQVGITLGVAVAGAVAGGSISSSLSRTFAEATHPAWWIVAALGVAILVLGLLTTSEWAEDTARRKRSPTSYGALTP
jgi:MFS family permease